MFSMKLAKLLPAIVGIILFFGLTTADATWYPMGNHEERAPIAKPGAPFEVTPGKPVAVNPGEFVELVTPSGIKVKVKPGEGVEITIDERTINPKGPLPDNEKSIGIFLDIETNASDVAVEATLSLSLEGRDLSGIDTTSLQFKYYDEQSQEWKGVPSWVENNIIYGNTTHFSVWTVAGSESSTTGNSLSLGILSTIIALGGIGLLSRKQKKLI